MILVDSSVWVNHLRQGDEQLVRLLGERRVLCHPFIAGELGLGNLHNRVVLLSSLRHLPQAVVARDVEVADMVERRALFGTGIGYVDAHLLASVFLTPTARLWSANRGLSQLASEYGVGFAEAH